MSFFIIFSSLENDSIFSIVYFLPIFKLDVLHLSIASINIMSENTTNFFNRELFLTIYRWSVFFIFILSIVTKWPYLRHLIMRNRILRMTIGESANIKNVHLTSSLRTLTFQHHVLALVDFYFLTVSTDLIWGNFCTIQNGRGNLIKLTVLQVKRPFEL